MKLDELLDKLLADARRSPPSDGVPYAFEQRVMHAVRLLQRSESAIAWASGLWRAVVPCVAVAALAVVTSIALVRPPNLEADTSLVTGDQTESLDTTGASALDPGEAQGESQW